MPWGSEWGCVALPLTCHPRVTLRCGGSEDSPRRWCLHLVSGEQPMLPRHPRDECGCLPSCQAFPLAPRLLSLAPVRGKGCSGPREGVLRRRGCGPSGDQLLAPHHPSDKTGGAQSPPPRTVGRLQRPFGWGSVLLLLSSAPFTELLLSPPWPRAAGACSAGH